MIKTATRKLLVISFLILTIFCSCQLAADETRKVGPSPEEAFSNPNLFTPKQLYNLARQSLASGKLDAARLFALRVFLDGKRSVNLLNLLGVIELQAKRPLLASEWFRKGLNLSLNNKVARRYLSRLPQKVMPIPVEPTKLADHFTSISEKVPELMAKISSANLHFNVIMKALARGQIYMALALSEEYEKKYPGPDGAALTALCAWYLGRNRDALQLAEQNLAKAPFHPILLFVKAMITDTHFASSSKSYFRVLYDLDKWKKALSLADKYSKFFPDSPDAFIIKAKIMLDIHRLEEAGKAIEEAGKRDPGNPEIDLLGVEYLLQKNQAEQASNRLNRAFRRGYNLPSVNLTAGLFAIQAGRINEVNLILNEARNSRPFTDPEAYPMYISILLMTDSIMDARIAMNEWKQRVTENSMVCYLEALYCFKTGANKEAVSWVAKGFEKNPNRLGILQFLIGFPALGDDPNLKALVNNRLAKAKIPGFSFQKVPPKRQKAAPVQPPATTNVGVAAGPAVTKGMFQITIGANIDGSAREMLAAELEKIYAKVASLIGGIKVPVFINLVAAEGLGPIVAMYEPENTTITVTSNYFDSEMLRSIILSGMDALGDDEVGGLIEDYPVHTLSKEVAQAMIHILIPESKTAGKSSAWLQQGLADILAGRTATLRYRLLVANRSINEKSAKLASINMLNSIFAEGYSSPAVLETANAQAYLMTAFLVKRTGSLQKGTAIVMEMIKKLSTGATLEDILKSKFNLSPSEFERGWKDAAFWALKQGAPYEWN